MRVVEPDIMAKKALRAGRGLIILWGALVLAAACGGAGVEPSPTAPGTPLVGPSPTVTLPDCPPSAAPFVIAPQGSFEVSLKVEEPTGIRAEAYWGVGPDRLALLLNGPQRRDLANPQAPYARRDGPSGALVIDYGIEASDVERGSDWRVRVANFGGQPAAGCLEVTATPLAGPTPTLAPLSYGGLYQVIYSRESDSCGTYPEQFQDVLDVRVQDVKIAIHQESTGDDSAGTIGRDGTFNTSGSGPTHLETYEGELNDNRIEAVNSFVQFGCEVKYSITGEKQ